jgi:hypothetical protein
MMKLIDAFRHYANTPENRLLAKEIESRFLGRPFCNLVFIPSFFGSDFHALRDASLHPSAIFLDVGRQRHACLDVQYCVGLYGVCMYVPREGTLSVGSVKREVILENTMSIQNANIHGTTVKFSGIECSFPVFFLNSYS